MGNLATGCPGCGRRIADGQVVCVACGYHLASEKPLDTKITEIKQRARAKRARRREWPLWQKFSLWIVGLAQTVFLVFVVTAITKEPDLAESARTLLDIYLVVGGLIILAYAIRDSTGWTILIGWGYWISLLADDANPYVVGLFMNMLLVPVLFLLPL